MSSEYQVQNFLSVDNFRLAFDRLRTASRNTYKELYYEDLKIFGLCLGENIETLLNEIQQEIFNPESSYKIFVPKKNNLVRPLSLLKFRELLVYQGIINVIADVVADVVSPYYNNIVFGNVYYTSKESAKNRIFFFKPWKQQWKAFEEKAEGHYNSNYNILAEFDIASFFDTIDHYILQQILENNYGIDTYLSGLLIKLLEAFTSDFSHKTFNSRHGIPQGPIGSPFLADLYLFHLDLEMKNSKLDIKYIRYVDDIKIFSKDKNTAKKAIAYLDLLARDLGLIPQISKIFINEINNIDEALGRQKNKFSLFTKEYKKKGSLNTKTQRNLKKQFLSCFDENSEREYLDKTIIKFSLYKLNKDEDVKAILLNRIDDLHIHFEEILFYLKKHYSDNPDVKTWLIEILRDDNILFRYIIALIFKFFPEIDFMEDVFKKYTQVKNRHWIVEYYILGWLYENKKFEIINNFSTSNYFVNRAVSDFKYKIIRDETYKKIFIKDMLKSQDCMIAIQGFYLLPVIPKLDESDFSEYNIHIQRLASGEMTDYIGHTLRKHFRILNSNSFFDVRMWNMMELYEELNMSFRFFFEYRSIDPSKSLLNLNSFNNLVHDKICERLLIPMPAKEYGVNLNSNCIVDKLPFTSQYFTQINDCRNQKTDAHPYDKKGDIRVRITVPELNTLVKKQTTALSEICNFFHDLH